MKRFLLINILALLLFCMAGCSDKETIKIEEHDWNLTFVLSSEDGRVLGCAPEHYEEHKEDKNIKEIDLDCIASDGKFTIADKTNNHEYNGTYCIR